MQADVGLKGWNIPFPAFADTIGGDRGGWRSSLADYGVGFIAYDLSSGAINTLGGPKSNRGAQAYWGQSRSAYTAMAMVLTVDMGRYGIQGGQLQIGSNFEASTWAPYAPPVMEFYRLAYYQALLDKKVEFNVGFMGNSFTYVGTAVGGQLQNPFGPQASIPSELGIATSAAIQPTAWVKVHPTENTYNLFGVMRSISPGGVYKDTQQNHSGLQFSAPGAKAVYVDEIGFKTAPSVNSGSTWLRAGFIYNTTPYKNYATGRSGKNYGAYILGDRQLTQSAPSSASTAYRGIYAGFSAMYADPKENTFTQYYEARVYGKGLMRSRPTDLISLVYNHNVTNKYLAEQYNGSAENTGVYATRYSNTITGSYTAHIIHGLYVTLGLQYTDRPSFTYLQKEGSALNLLANTFIAF